MSSDEPDPKPKHRSFELTPERQLPTRHRVARAFIVLALLTLLVSALVMCSCPGFFAIMAACLVVSLICGSRLQRLLSVGLLLVAVAGFVIQFRAEQRSAEHLRHIRERAAQQIQSQ
jgi:hypothetical protein